MANSGDIYCRNTAAPNVAHDMKFAARLFGSPLLKVRLRTAPSGGHHKPGCSNPHQRKTHTLNAGLFPVHPSARDYVDQRPYGWAQYPAANTYRLPAVFEKD